MNIPDPRLSISEALRLMGLTQRHLAVKRDAVYDSAWVKLRDSVNYVAEHNPEEFEKAEREIAMEKRFTGRG